MPINLKSGFFILKQSGCPPDDRTHLIADILQVPLLSFIWLFCRLHLAGQTPSKDPVFPQKSKGILTVSYKPTGTTFISVYVYPRPRNSLVQFGAVPDHVPLARHWRVVEPVSKNPSMHEYTMEWEKVVPSRREMWPWVGVAGLLHCTAERQDRKVRDVEAQWIFYFSYQ